MDRATIDIYNARAEEYSQLAQEPTPDAQLRAFLDMLPKAARVLDLGCGPGRSAGMMAAEGHQVTAIDASEGMIALAEKLSGVTAYLGTFDNLPDGPFEGVWANFSLLHASQQDLPRYIADVHARLTAGGVFHVAMKVGQGESRDAIGRRYVYVAEDELIDMLRDAGFVTFDVDRGNGVGLSGEYADWVAIRAQTR